MPHKSAVHSLKSAMKLFQLTKAFPHLLKFSRKRKINAATLLPWGKKTHPFLGNKEMKSRCSIGLRKVLMRECWQCDMRDSSASTNCVCTSSGQASKEMRQRSRSAWDAGCTAGPSHCLADSHSCVACNQKHLLGPPNTQKASNTVFFPNEKKNSSKHAGIPPHHCQD